MADYITSETDASIKEYIEAQDISQKHEIFNKHIKPAFEKLVENLIYVYGFYTLDDVETLKRDALTNLFEVLPKFDASRGKKSFSYFNVVCKNWFIQKIRERDKQLKGTVSTDTMFDIDSEMVNSNAARVMRPHEDDIMDKEFWKSLFENMDAWRKFPLKKTEKQVLEAIIFLLQNPSFITIYNKKAIYLYLREMTGLNTKQVVFNLKKIKELYVNFKDKFDTTGEGDAGPAD